MPKRARPLEKPAVEQRRVRKCAACGIHGHIFTNTKKCVVNVRFQLKPRAAVKGQQILQTEGPKELVADFLGLGMVGRMTCLASSYKFKESVFTRITLVAIDQRCERSHHKSHRLYGLEIMSFKSQLHDPRKLFAFIAKIHKIGQSRPTLFEEARAASIRSLRVPANQRHETYDHVWSKKEECEKYARLLEDGCYSESSESESASPRRGS
jgi:hypothetical protein